MNLTLFHYWRSTSSWRVRWAYIYKNLESQGVQLKYESINLLAEESETPEHRARNPLGYVPALEIPGGFLIESIAILEWMEERFPNSPKLLPADLELRARTRALTQIINADTQPLQNLNPQFFHSSEPTKRKEWAQHFIREGLAAYEAYVKPTAGIYSVGNQLTMADLCLIPQCYNADRYEISLDAYPTIQKIVKNCTSLESYTQSHPDAFKPA